MQELIDGAAFSPRFQALCETFRVRCVFLVCGGSFLRTPLYGTLCAAARSMGVRLVPFHAFSPNPEAASVRDGLALFRREGCDMLVAAGGGSAMDVAKCVKLYCLAREAVDWLSQDPVPSAVPFLAIPTTAGSGSEATRFAVVYRDGVKHSVSHPSGKPGFVVLEPSLLATLPGYQKKAALMDALCHSVESYWSVRSAPESQALGAQALHLLREHGERYLDGDSDSLAPVLRAAHLAGGAIDLAQTTAAHAMSYRLTTLCGIAHGHAAALCLPAVWRFTRNHPEQCADPRGPASLARTLDELRGLLGCAEGEDGADRLDAWNARLGLAAPPLPEHEDPSTLEASVNPQRLGNHPVSFRPGQLAELYRAVLDPGKFESQ